MGCLLVLREEVEGWMQGLRLDGCEVLGEETDMRLEMGRKEMYCDRVGGRVVCYDILARVRGLAL